MGRGNPNPSVKWKKGQSGNPAGMKAGILPKREWKMHTAASVAETFSKYQDMSIPDLRIVSKSETLPALEVIIATALLKDRLEGQVENTEKILDRCVGKVKQVQEFQSPGGAPLIPPSINFVPVDPGTIVPKVTEETP